MTLRKRTTRNTNDGDKAGHHNGPSSGQIHNPKPSKAKKAVKKLGVQTQRLTRPLWLLDQTGLIKEYGRTQEEQVPKNSKRQVHGKMNQHPPRGKINQRTQNVQERQNTMINGNRGNRGSLAHTAKPTKIGTNGRDTTPRSKEARKERAPVGTHIKEQSQKQIRPK